MATPPSFTTGQVLTAAQMNAVGLWLVKSQTVGTGVSSVTVTGAFSADYDNYRIVLSNIDASSQNQAMIIQLNNSTGASYYSTSNYMLYSSAGFNGFISGASTGAYTGWSDTVSGTSYCLDVMNPFISGVTNFATAGANTVLTWVNGCIDTAGNSNTGFTLYPVGGTLTGGTISVYGYRK